MPLFKSISIACSLIDSVLFLNAPYDTDCPSNTGTSADMGNNVSDIKEYSSKNFSYKNRCVICGAELDYEENNICDDCLETLYEERIYSLRENAVKAMKENSNKENVNNEK